MFISNRIAYTELHKTASTHIQTLLKMVEPGEIIGKHNKIPVKYRDRFIIGSIRNPWDWYVSLWAYGCNHRGSVYRQLTRNLDTIYNLTSLPSEMGKRFPGIFDVITQTWYDYKKDIEKWQRVYSDKSNPEHFQSWLAQLLSYENRYDLAEGYGFSPISRNFGLLSYRFFKLHTVLDSKIYSDSELLSLPGLKSIWQKYSMVDFFIRNESLESDFLEAMSKAGVHVSEENIEKIISKKENKENVSNRESISYYYDEKSIELVAQKEAFIIEQFDYSFAD